MDTPAGKSLPPRTVEVLTALENYTPTVSVTLYFLQQQLTLVWCATQRFIVCSRILVAALISQLSLHQVPEELVQHHMRRNGDDGSDPQL